MRGFFSIRNNRGSTLVAATITLALVGFMGASLLETSDTGNSSATNEFQTTQALQIGNGGIQYALSQIDKGLSPDIQGKELGAGTFSVVSDPTTGALNVTAKVGVAYKEQGVTTSFASDVMNLDTTPSYLENNGSTLLSGFEISKSGHSMAYLAAITVNWNTSVCAQSYDCGDAVAGVIDDSDSKDKDDSASDDDGSEDEDDDTSNDDSDSKDKDDSASNDNDDGSEDEDDDTSNDDSDSKDIDDSASDDDSDSKDKDADAKQGGNKQEVCHIPPGNPNNAHTITVSASAVDAHLAHGDTLASCNPEDNATPLVCQGYDSEIANCVASTSDAHVTGITINGVAIQLAEKQYNSGQQIDIPDYGFSTDTTYVANQIDFDTKLPDGTWYSITLTYADGSEVTESFKFGQ